MIFATNLHNWRRQFQQEDRGFDLDQFLREVAELGMAGVEVRMKDEWTGSAAHLKGKLREHGLKAVAIGAGVTAEPHEPNVADYQAQIQAAAELEAPLLMVCGGFLPNNRRNTYAEDYDKFAESLAPTMQYAADHGVTLAFHPHRGCIVETVAETQQMLDRLPELKLCMDTAHLAAAGENAGNFAETFADRIVHTHIKDFDSQTLEFREPGLGNSPLCPLPEVLQTLAKAGYQGPLCLELDGKAELDRTAAESAALSLQFMRKHLPESALKS